MSPIVTTEQPGTLERSPKAQLREVGPRRQRMTRRPPPVEHGFLPDDVVQLTRTLSEDWQEGETYTVRAITAAAPNVLQLEDTATGRTTFVPSYEVHDAQARRRQGLQAYHRQQAYLNWP